MLVDIVLYEFRLEARRNADKLLLLRAGEYV
jgi:hypothetical protein